MIKTKSNRYIENKYNFETEKNILDCDKLTNLIKNNFIYSLNYQLKNSPPNSKLSRLSDKMILVSIQELVGIYIPFGEFILIH